MKFLLSHKKILTIGILILVGFSYGYKKFFAAKSESRISQSTKVGKDTIVSSVSASGKVVSTNVIEVGTEATGIVKRVYVSDGQKVTAGQKLFEFTLDLTGQKNQANAWSAYLSAKNSVDSSNTNLYTLQSALFAANQKFINDAVARELATDDPTYIQQNADWLAAEAKYKSGFQAVEQAKAALGNASLAYKSASGIVTAPISGTIKNITLVEGMSISESTARAAVITNSEKAIVRLDLSEIDVSRVKQGQKVTIKVDSLGDKSYTGVVKAVDKIGSTSSNVTAYPAWVVLDTFSDQILPNMSASGNIILDAKQNVLVVPNSAITINNDSSFVTKLDSNGREQQVVVETGLTSDSYTEIISGLSEGDEVVTGYTTNSASSTSSSNNLFGGFGGVRTGGFSGGGGQIRITR